MMDSDTVHSVEAPSPVRPPRLARREVDSLVPIVIDNGAFHCRVSWADDQRPLVDFRSILSKPRLRATGEVVNVVGDFDTSVRGLEFPRSAVRSAFDGNVVYQFETQEAVLDYAFDRLGIEEGQVQHPVLLTECLCNPLSSRASMAELMFEAYGVPSLALGTDAAFSHRHNRRLERCGADGIVVACGHSASHAVAMVGGEPLLRASVRLSVGGAHVTSLLQRLLALRYPQHTAALTWERAETMKRRFCYVAPDYAAELPRFQDAGGSGGASVAVQLPWVAAPAPVEVGEEELARRAAVRERAVQRLKDMAASKRALKLEERQAQHQQMQELVDKLERTPGEAAAAALLAAAGLKSRAAAAAQLSKLAGELRRLLGEPEPEPVAAPEEEQFPLLGVPDSQLTAEQVKEKRRQRLLKGAAEGRARVRERKEAAKAAAEQQRQLEEEQWRADPVAFVEDLRARVAAAEEKVEARRPHKHGAGPEGAAGAVGAGGRRDRLGAAHRERMKLLVAAAADTGGKADTFGGRDEDWQLYKRMSMRPGDADETEGAEAEAELQRLREQLCQLDDTFREAELASKAPAPVRAPCAEDFQVRVGVERIRAAEVLFQPSLIGVDQAGLAEIVELALQRASPEERRRLERGAVLLTGGAAQLPGMELRLLLELMKTRPLGEKLRVVAGAEPSLDAWLGAANWSLSSASRHQFFTKAEYEERGAEWLRGYKLAYSC